MGEDKRPDHLKFKSEKHPEGGTFGFANEEIKKIFYDRLDNLIGKKIDKSEWKTKKPKLFEYDSKNGVVDIFVRQDPGCPFPFHKDDWYHQGFYLKSFITYLRDFFRRNNIDYKVINDELDDYLK